jgi:hypothetical protein
MTLLHAIEACLRATRLPASRFGRNAVGDPRLVHDLRRGREPGPAMERRVRAYIANLRGESAPRPSAPAGNQPTAPAGDR